MSLVFDRFTLRNGLFPICPPTSAINSNWDYAVISARTASTLFYMLEDSGFTTAGSALIGANIYDVNYTMRFGASALAPFTPNSFSSGGSYYDTVTGNPSALPHRRTCSDSILPMSVIRYNASDSIARRVFSFQAYIGFTSGEFRLYYNFRMSHQESSTSPFSGRGVTICNPSFAPGGAPNSGILTFGNIDLNWVGGEHTNAAWTANAASTSALESTLQFYFY